jgi:hypothetical protein
VQGAPVQELTALGATKPLPLSKVVVSAGKEFAVRTLTLPMVQLEGIAKKLAPAVTVAPFM